MLGADKVRDVQGRYLARSRLKIPLLFMADIIYGYKTVFPIPLGLGCTWDPARIREDYAIVAREAHADGGMVTFSPAVDLVRDARWGRCMENTGEDPWLNACFARAMVEGFQAGLENGEGIASCVKHFAAYGAVEAGREYNTVDMGERRLRQDYLPGYKAAIEAGAKLVMTSFNTVDGIPATGNRWLLDGILRKEWGFDGPIVSDFAAIRELKTHGFAENDQQAAALALNATVDIDMMTSCYALQLPALVREGKVDIRQVDNACWRVLRLKNELGLFEDPYRGADAGKPPLRSTTQHMLPPRWRRPKGPRYSSKTAAACSRCPNVAKKSPSSGPMLTIPACWACGLSTRTRIAALRSAPPWRPTSAAARRAAQCSTTPPA